LSVQASKKEYFCIVWKATDCMLQRLKPNCMQQDNVPVMKGCKWYSLKKDIQLFITGASKISKCMQ